MLAARLIEIGDEDAEAAAGLWFRAIADRVITLFPDEEDISPPVKLALRLKHPLRDSLYLAFAESIGVSLITADQDFVEKASGAHQCIPHLTAVS